METVMKTEIIRHPHNAVELHSHLAYPNSRQEKCPAVLIAPDWAGRNDEYCKRAEDIAALGYIAMTLDMYGQGKTGRDKEENAALMTPFMEDRRLLRERMNSALETLKRVKGVDANRLAAIGYCFGGLCVLDLARSGAQLKGVISFHGLLGAAEHLPNQTIHAKVLALHGHDDPMVTPDEVVAFETEMTKAKADWQMHIFGHTMHAFTNPQANDPSFGTVYNKAANEHSWIFIQQFFI